MLNLGSASLKKEILDQINTLPSELQQKVLEFIHSLTRGLPKGILGKNLLKFAGIISLDDLKIMIETIEDGCEQIDVHEW